MLMTWTDPDSPGAATLSSGLPGAFELSLRSIKSSVSLSVSDRRRSESKVLHLR